MYSRKHSNIQAWVENIEVKRLIWTYFLHLFALSTLYNHSILYRHDGRPNKNKPKKKGGKYNLLMTHCICWRAYLIWARERTLSLAPAGSFHITLDSLPMQQILFDTHMHQGTCAHTYLSSYSIWPCALRSNSEDVTASCHPGGNKTKPGEVMHSGNRVLEFQAAEKKA